MREIRKLLVPVDFSSCSRTALEYAVSLAEKLGAEIDVLHAWTAPAYVSPYVAVQVSTGGPSQTLETLAREEAEKEMSQFLASVPKPGGKEIGVRIEYGFEADVITSAAASYDLVVMGTHGRKGLAHLLIGSVAERVVRQCPVPVLTVRC
jgi:universal stress protein A